MPYRLEPDEPLVGGLFRAAAEATGAAAARLDRARDDPAGGAHEARKHGKEARAALRLLRGDIAPAPYAAALSTVRDANRRLATARDSQAMLDTLERLRQHRRLLRRERETAEAALRHRRDDALGALDDEQLAVAAAAFRTAQRTVAAAARVAESVDAGSSSVGEQLARLHRRGRRRMRIAARSATSEAFHGWRRDAKDLWYAVRLFGPAWPGPLDALALELHHLARALGDEHDLAVLAAGLGSEGNGLLTARLARAVAREQEARRSEALALGARIWAERPAGFARRLLAYHAAWT